MSFQPERLISLRNNAGINKAEAARQLNMSAMGYGRYESGEREPSYQVVSYIAQVFGTTVDYLYGNTDVVSSNTITLSEADDPELFEFVRLYKGNKSISKKALSYIEQYISQEGTHE